MKKNNKKIVEKNKSVIEEKKAITNNKQILLTIVILLVIVAFISGFFVSKILSSDKNENNESSNKENNNNSNVNPVDIQEGENKDDEEGHEIPVGQIVIDSGNVKDRLGKETNMLIDSMKTTITADILNNNYYAYVVSCKEIGNGETQNSFKEVSIKSIETIAAKLKTATKMEKGNPVGYIGTCTPKNVDFVITNTQNSLEGKKLIIMYGYNGDSLDVGFNGETYSFYFENSSDLDNFIESLT